MNGTTALGTANVSGNLVVSGTSNSLSGTTSLGTANVSGNLAVSGTSVCNNHRIISYSNQVVSGSGFVGEVRYDFGQPRVLTNQSNLAENVYNVNGAFVTVSQGVWQITAIANVSNVAPVFYQVAICNNLGQALSGTVDGSCPSSNSVAAPNNTYRVRTASLPLIIQTDAPGTTFFSGINVVQSSSSGYRFETWIRAVRLA